MWRIMKFRPADQDGRKAATRCPTTSTPTRMMRPASSKDTKFFWDGVNAHELRIQKRADGSAAASAGARTAGWTRKLPTDISGGQRARARCSASSCTTRRRCPAAPLPFVIAAGRTRRGCAGCSASSAMSTRQGGDRNARARNVHRLPDGRRRAGLDPLRVGAPD